jgi:hypothetical protein
MQRVENVNEGKRREWLRHGEGRDAVSLSLLDTVRLLRRFAPRNDGFVRNRRHRLRSPQ